MSKVVIYPSDSDPCMKRYTHSRLPEHLDHYTDTTTPSHCCLDFRYSWSWKLFLGRRCSYARKSVSIVNTVIVFDQHFVSRFTYSTTTEFPPIDLTEQEAYGRQTKCERDHDCGRRDCSRTQVKGQVETYPRCHEALGFFI